MTIKELCAITVPGKPRPPYLSSQNPPRIVIAGCVTAHSAEESKMTVSDHTGEYTVTASPAFPITEVRQHDWVRVHFLLLATGQPPRPIVMEKLRSGEEFLMHLVTAMRSRQISLAGVGMDGLDQSGGMNTLDSFYGGALG